MSRKTRKSSRWLAMAGGFFFFVAAIATGQTPSAPKPSAEDAAGFKEFSARVADYVKLHKSVEKEVPALKGKEELPEMISAQQQALARKIREKRPNAKPGDIFTRGSRDAFRHVIRDVFRDPKNSTKHTTDRQRITGKPVRVQINGIYPDADAETTFPPTLLERLPVLPEEVAYRIVGRDLVLVDRKANLVVDLLHEALP